MVQLPGFCFVGELLTEFRWPMANLDIYFQLHPLRTSLVASWRPPRFIVIELRTKNINQNSSTNAGGTRSYCCSKFWCLAKNVVIMF